MDSELYNCTTYLVFIMISMKYNLFCIDSLLQAAGGLRIVIFEEFKYFKYPLFVVFDMF